MAIARRLIKVNVIQMSSDQNSIAAYAEVSGSCFRRIAVMTMRSLCHHT